MEPPHSPLFTGEKAAVTVVAVGGLDPGGGAGITRDLLSLRDLGARVLLVGTAWTDQSPEGVTGFEPRDPGALAAALRAALQQAPRGATSVKVGMTATPAIVHSIVNALEGFDGPVVFDPVLAASSGGPLFDGAPADLAPLTARAHLVTPNLAEAAALAGLPPLTTVDDARAAARRLWAAGARAVLVKGGHLPAGEATDVLVDAAPRAAAAPAGDEAGREPPAPRERLFSSARVPGLSPRGTGCALASAIAAGLAGGQELAMAVGAARAWLLERIRGARPPAGGRGGGERHLSG